MKAREAIAPVVVLLAGLPGVGKTTLAKALAPVLNAEILNRDDIRDAIFPERQLDFSTEQNEVATRTLLAVLSYILEHDPPAAVIIDGKPFSRRHEIDEVRDRVAASGAELKILHCTAPAEEVARRLREGLRDTKNVRAARNPEKANRIRRLFEPIEEPYLEMEMTWPLEALIGQAADFIHSARS